MSLYKTLILNKVIINNGSAKIYLIVGTGQPEGVITAPVGSEYTQTDGLPGTIKWGKQSGSGNTGWVPIW